MAEIQLGHAVVWGQTAVTALTKGTTQAGASTAVAVKITGMSFSKSSSVDETVDASGDFGNVTLHGFKKTLSIECYPYGSSVSAANTANALPDVGDVLKIVAATTQDVDIAATAGTYWTILQADKARTNTAKTMWTLQCAKWTGISSHDQLS